MEHFITASFVFVFFFKKKSARKHDIHANTHTLGKIIKKEGAFHWVGCVGMGVRPWSRQPLDVFILYLHSLL